MNDVCNIFPSLTSFPMLHLSTYYLDALCTSNRVDVICEGSQSVFPSPPSPPPPSDRKFDDVLIYHAAPAARDNGGESAFHAGKSLYGGWRSIEAAIFPPLISHSPNHFLLHLLLLLPKVPIKCCACVGCQDTFPGCPNYPIPKQYMLVKKNS